jgi:hypothetical protein
MPHVLPQLFMVAADIAKKSGEDKAHFKANALAKAGQVGAGGAVKRIIAGVVWLCSICTGELSLCSICT